MTWIKAPPKLSEEAKQWAKRFPDSPVKQTSRADTAPYIIPTCAECDGELHEDMLNGQMVCHECGYTERLLISDAPEFVCLTHSSLVTKSQHKPCVYVKQLVRKYGIDSKLEPELLRRYQAIIYWSDRNKPAGRKSLPNYRKSNENVVAIYISLIDYILHLQLLHCTDSSYN